MPKKSFDRFATQTDALANAKRILWKWVIKPGEPINDPQDLADIEAMIRNHPNSAGIIGPGVKYHCVMGHSRGSFGFRTVRVDDTVDAWSYRTAITGKYRSSDELIRNALRWEVQGFVEAARKRWLSEHGPLNDSDFRHAHHGRPWPFKRIVAHFIEDELCASIEEIEIEKAVVDGEEVIGAWQLKDPTLAERWRTFHNSRANIKFISDAVHERITGKNATVRKDLDDDDDFEGVTE